MTVPDSTSKPAVALSVRTPVVPEIVPPVNWTPASVWVKVPMFNVPPETTIVVVLVSAPLIPSAKVPPDTVVLAVIEPAAFAFKVPPVTDVAESMEPAALAFNIPALTVVAPV